MSFYRGMTCENVTLNGDKGTPITAYVSKASGPGPFPGVVLVHHLPGWSEFYIETTRRFAHHGYLAICANLYERAGQGNPDDVAAKVRADGGIPDAQMVGDTEAAVKWMRAKSNHNGKVGLFGSCLGGRPAFIYACQRKDVDACADLWGGRVVMGKEELNAKTPVARCTSSTATTVLATASSIGTGHSTGPSRPWMAGARCSPSRQASGEVGGPDMCTSIIRHHGLCSLNLAVCG